jgi:mRNA interferase MazF
MISGDYTTDVFNAPQRRVNLSITIIALRITKLLRGEIWAVDFEPQTLRQEPGKKERPALVIQTDALNKSGHPTTIVIPGTSNVESNTRFMFRYTAVQINHLKKVEEALRLLTSR